LKKKLVLKVGGAILLNDLEGLWQWIKTIEPDWELIIVHGAGPQTSELTRQLGGEVKQFRGRRITGDLDLNALLYAARGALSARICAAGYRLKLNPVGLSGVDAGLIQVERRPPWLYEGEQIDFGWVGDVKHVESALLNLLVKQGWVPVIATLGVDQQGNIYNVNGDTCALEIASAVGADALWFLTETGGVVLKGNVLEQMNPQGLEQAVKETWVSGGMEVKLSCGFEALRRDIAEVRLLSMTSDGTRLIR